MKHIILVLSSICLLGCSNSYDKIKKEIKVGQSKQVIIELLGEPDSIEQFTKTETGRWFGPISGYWDELAVDTQIEIWLYKFPDGNLSLSFIDKGENLKYKSFTLEGVVY